MSLRHTFRRLGREWLVALASYALLVAPFGCQFSTNLLDGQSDGDGLNTQSAGLFVNKDTSDPLIVAGRNAAGDAFFVYGTRQASGAIGEVNSIVIQTAGGKHAFIVFELGRPAYLEGPDGSYARITYDEVSLQRLAATAKVYDAGTGETQTVNADVDLQQTAAQVAAAVERVTGQKLDVPTARAIGTGKWHSRAADPLVQILIVTPLVAVSQLMIVIMGQVMQAVFEAVTFAFQAAVVAAFWPLFMFAAILGDVTVNVETVPLLDIFIELPPAPTIDITVL